MRKILPWLMALVLAATATAASAQAKPKPKAPSKTPPATQSAPAPAPQPKAVSLKCVGLYSETDAGYVSYRVGTGAWTVVKVGDTIPPDAEVEVTVDRDWVEFTPSDNPSAVYELNAENGPVTKKVADVVKGTARTVKTPKGSGDSPDPAFKDKLVVTEYLGRQIYTDPKGDEKDVKYGDVLATGGRVTIIAINNTITLMNASGKVTTVIGPLKFEVDKVLKNEKLYKFLNVPR
ncbi:MAG TPA: hypothetical protein VFG59_17775 [Anaeromyxobacter sp.]|nr:hypothetical protein [Anaeromyxobacter sp.]